MIYVYECPDCGGTKEEFRKVEERNNPVNCDLCGIAMQRVIGGHSVVGDVDPYWDDNLECGIKSKQHRKQVMREKGVYEKYGKGWI